MTNQTPIQKGSLEGIRVIDFSIMMAGPLSSRYLADLGAEVIKIEAPEGDYIRSRAPLRDGNSTYFGHLNCGKKSIVLNLKDPADKARVLELIHEGDVLIENFRPGVMKKLGLDFETVARINPRLVYCSVSGFGQSGPGAHRPAYAQIVHASSGFDLAFLGYQNGQSRPPNSAIFIADTLGASFALAGIMTALFQRHSTGRGQYVDVALIESMMNLMVYEFQAAQFPVQEKRPVYPPLLTTDGFVMLCPTTQKNFESLCDALGHPEWVNDPRFETIPERSRNWDVFMSYIEDWTKQRSAAECEVAMNDAGVPCSRYRSVQEAVEDPQFAFRESFARVKDAAGSYLVPNLPFKLSDSTVIARPFVASLGEHQQEVLGRKEPA